METMYLIDDSISRYITSWDIDARGGSVKPKPENGAWYIQLKSKNDRFANSMKRTLPLQKSGVLIYETAIMLNMEKSGFSISFSDEEDTPFIDFNTKESGFYLNDTFIREYDKDCMWRLKIIIDLDRGICSCELNGNPAAEIPFTAGGVKHVTIKTPKQNCYEARIYFIRCYKGYLINENFALYGGGNLPKGDWKTDGDMYIRKKAGLSVPYDHALYMKKGASLSQDIPKMDGRLLAEFMTLSDNFSVKLGELEIKADKSGVFANNERIGDTSLAYWSLFRIEYKNGVAEIKMNRRVRCEIKCALPEKIEFISGDELWVDNIKVSCPDPIPSDYVPKPKPVRRDDIHVGMMACSIWHEGGHFGWDKINPFPERKPYNGFYDEGNIEQADWEIKYLCEHGIEYEIFCWYAPREWLEGAVQPREAAIDAFFNAEYRDNLKITFMWENGASKTSQKGFYENLVPYWIEYYFKQPEFLVIDNKPVIYIYTHWGLRDHFGAPENTRAAMEYLDAECKKAGFDGVIIIQALNQRIKNAFLEVKSMGIDNVFSYAWGTDSTIDQQKDVLTKQHNYGVLDIVPTVSIGWDDKPWIGRASGYYIPPKELTELIKWVRSEHHSRYEKDKIASRMMVLDNWNEYGEGHYFMPTPMTGFDYLEAVKEGLELQNEHSDVVPEGAQLDRLCKLYNTDRVLYKTCYLAPHASDRVLKGWYFKEEKDVESWKANSGISNFVKGENTITGHTEADGAFTLELSEGIDINNASTLRVTIRLENHDFDQFKVWFATEEEPEFCEENTINGYSYESFLRGWMLPAGSRPGWHGKLKKLRLYPNTTGGDFEIEAVEILENEIKMPQLSVNNTLVRMTNCEYIQNDVLIAINEDILKAVNMAMVSQSDGSVILKADTKNEIVLKPGEKNARLNDREITLSAICIEKDRFFMIPFVEIMTVLGYNITYDNDSITVHY
ncbi:MAG: glycoside hydrolase family 99-like domain-containing protein [Clostridia bacterium]|nr:glycoside hydrolase family 99-like domain-containing protein [Clostridia bacterium]MBP3360222.1 glycoside hydrolase family 99-like domain-containing protein [Clostridia bacterium]